MSTELRVENYSLEKITCLLIMTAIETDEGKESETNEDKQKNEVRDAFTTFLS